ncbi:energy transducer TonB [Acidithiobacillus ferruginosus]|uniref:Energy transducer TonB n=1 Tax=Acidithiobacillus ferruginosus TaxID=3063951 RepID=A0ACD5IEV9_9PROT|nr:energy transducer TonB [Acidithiobacillus ferruginosus]MBU2815726.1 energy transducer TonB [Acidithiobacillus ferruginosus]
MNAATSLSSPVQSPKFRKDHFGRALIIGAIIEALMIGGLIYSHLSQPVTVKPKPKIMAIHMIKPAPPKPKPVPPPPKPVVHPKPIPKPVPLPPLPRPIPRPVVHHPLPPKPLLAKTSAPQAPVYTPPVTPPAPPPPPAPSPAARQSAIDTYAAMLRTRVQANARVPDSVRMMHVGGTAVISFRLTPSGHLLSAQVAKSSGIGAINRAALKTVENTSFPPFIKKMPKHPMTFDVLVHLSAHGS